MWHLELDDSIFNSHILCLLCIFSVIVVGILEFCVQSSFLNFGEYYAGNIFLETDLVKRSLSRSNIMMCSSLPRGIHLLSKAFQAGNISFPYYQDWRYYWHALPKSSAIVKVNTVFKVKVRPTLFTKMEILSRLIILSRVEFIPMSP